MTRSGKSGAATIRLDPVLDIKQAAPLAAALLAERGGPLIVDGAAVERLGGQCLQVLLAAQRSWGAAGHPFHLSDPSPALTEALAVFGAAALAQPLAVGAGA